MQLFRRLPRGVELTSAGQALFREAKAMLAHLDRAVETTRRSARGEQGILCVGIAPTAPFNPLVPKAIRSFREKFPLVSLVLEEGLSNEVVTRFNNNQMDVAFVRARQIHADGVVGHAAAGGADGCSIAQPSSDGESRQGRAAEESCERSLYSDRSHRGPACMTRLSRPAGPPASFRVSASRRRELHRLSAWSRRVSASPWCRQRRRACAWTGWLIGACGGAAPKAFLGLASRKGDSSPVLRQFLNLVRSIAKRHPSG